MQLANLREHRERLLSDMVSTMKASLAMSDPRMIGEILRDSEDFGKEVETERKLLQERRDAMRGAAVEEIDK
eukprot:COSAG05_NODE_21854_length_269_cov_0.494118_1_plen_71_part_01